MPRFIANQRTLWKGRMRERGEVVEDFDANRTDVVSCGIIVPESEFRGSILTQQVGVVADPAPTPAKGKKKKE